jgi:hypothetical protein
MSSATHFLESGHNRRDNQNTPASIRVLSQNVKYSQKGSPESNFASTHLNYASRLLAIVVASKTRTSPLSSIVEARFCNLFAKKQTFLCAISRPCSLSLHTRCTALNLILPPASTPASRAFKSISSPTVHAQPPISPLSFPPAPNRCRSRNGRLFQEKGHQERGEQE